jgi:sugar/nucleoside kinase (ribokinase family)
VDRIKNIRGTRVQPGGAALYAAMGAKTVCREVGILTAVGDNYPFMDLFGDFSATVKKVKGKNTEFIITYDKDWNAAYRSVSIGPGSKITARDTLSLVNGGVKVVHLAPMNPPKVKRMVEGIKKMDRNVVVSINACINYLDVKANQRATLEAAALSDIFIINDRELHALTGIEVMSKAIKSIRTKMLVLTLGEVGTLVSTSEGTEFVPAMAAMTKNAVDVTGAGDTWAGSFLASYFLTKSWIKAVSFASVVSAVKCTGWNFEKIRKLRFDSVEDAFDLAIALKEKGRQLTLSDSLRSIKWE